MSGKLFEIKEHEKIIVTEALPIISKAVGVMICEHRPLYAASKDELIEKMAEKMKSDICLYIDNQINFYSKINSKTKL